MRAIPQHRQPRALTLEDSPVVARVRVCLCLCGKRGHAAPANFQSKGDQVTMKDVKRTEFCESLRCIKRPGIVSVV